MASTRFSSINADFTKEVHEVAIVTLYPKAFSADSSRLEFESTLVGDDERKTMLDGEMATDCIARVTAQDPRLGAPLSFTVQERWRHPSYAAFRDATITEWNSASGLPGELYKINADLFFYGYYSRPFTVGTFGQIYDLLQSNPNLPVFKWSQYVPALRLNKAMPELWHFGNEHRLWYPKGEKRIATLSATPQGLQFLKQAKESRRAGCITEAIMFNVAAVKLGICKGELAYTWPDVNSRTGQTFIGIKIDQLKAPPYCVFHIRRRGKCPPS